MEVTRRSKQIKGKEQHATFAMLSCISEEASILRGNRIKGRIREKEQHAPFIVSKRDASTFKYLSLRI